MLSLEMLGFLIFLAAIMVLGTWHNQRIYDLDDYIVSGRSLSFFTIVGALLSTWIGAGSILGLASETYTSGSLQSVIAVPFGCGLGSLLLGFFGSEKIRKYECYTISDIIAFHYGKFTAMIFAFFLMLQYIFIVGLQFRAMGTMFHHFTGFGLTFGSLLCAICVGVYVHRGGLWSLVTTDLVQLKAIALLAIISIFILMHSDYPFGTFAILAKALPDALPPSAFASIQQQENYWGQLLLGIASGALGQDVVQRILAAKTDHTAKWATTAASIVFIAICLVPISVGLVARGSGFSVAEAQRVFPEFIAQYGNQTLLFLFYLGILAAIIGSADSMLLAGSSLLARNIVFEISPMGKDNEVPLVRICNLIIMMLAFAVSCKFQAFYGLMVYSSSATLVTCFVSCAAALFVKNPQRLPAFLSFVSGLLIWLYWLWTSVPPADTPGAISETTISAASCYGFVASIIGYLGGSAALYFHKNLQPMFGKNKEVRTRSIAPHRYL